MQARTTGEFLGLELSALFLAALVAVALTGCRRPGDGDSMAGPSPPEPAEESRTTGRDEAPEVAVPAPGTGTVEGTVRFVGERLPPSTIVPVGADARYCGHQYSKEDWVIDPDSRGIRYVIVHLAGDGLDGWEPTKPGYLVLDNRECRFEPHAAVLTEGSTLEVKNSDKILHTAHAYFGATFNLALPEGGDSVKRLLRRPGIVQFRCDNHGWMNAFIRVDPHPFHAVTDSRGRFRIEGVPPGTYTLDAWHERSGAKNEQISVIEQQTTKVDFTFTE